MKNVAKTGQVNVLVKVKKPKRFKAGAECSSAVNLEIEKEVIGETELLQIQLKIDHTSDLEDHCSN